MKKAIVIAVLAALAPPAFADSSNVTIYGKARGALEFDNKDAGGGASQTKVSNASSRIGFKGTEDLGNGLKTIWQIESGVALDDGASNASNGSFATRDTWVGLEGSWGNVKLGRETSPLDAVASRYDGFQSGTKMAEFFEQSNTIVNGAVSTAAQKDPHVVANTRKNNAVLYTSPKFGGVDGALQWYTNENKTSSTSASAGYSLRLSYASNGLGVDYGFEQNKRGGSTTPTKETAHVLSLGYDVMPSLTLGGKLYLQKNDRTGGGDKDKGWGVFANFKASSEITLRGFYGRVKAEREDSTETAADWTKKRFILGAHYALSKRTVAFVEYVGEKQDFKPSTSTDTSKRFVYLGLGHDF